MQNYIVTSELELRKFEIQANLEKQKLELEMKRLELKSRSNFDMLDSQIPFDITKYIKLVPPFLEQDVDKYFLHFEKVAYNLKWPKEYWSMLLQSVLVGRAREIYTQLSVEQASSYDTLKDLILKSYELVPEAYRQKFRSCEKESNQTYVEFARIKEQLFNRWCDSMEVNQDYDQLCQLVLIEEFKRCIHSDIRTFIDEQKVENLETVARLADDYSLTHRISSSTKPTYQSFQLRGRNDCSSFQSKSIIKDNFTKSRSAAPFHQSDFHSVGYSPKTKFLVSSNKKNGLTCNYCKKEGHLLSDCFKLKQKQAL